MEINERGSKALKPALIIITASCTSYTLTLTYHHNSIPETMTTGLWSN